MASRPGDNNVLRRWRPICTYSTICRRVGQHMGIAAEAEQRTQSEGLYLSGRLYAAPTRICSGGDGRGLMNVAVDIPSSLYIQGSFVLLAARVQKTFHSDSNNRVLLIFYACRPCRATQLKSSPERTDARAAFGM
jgi:hypothetical protein